MDCVARRTTENLQRLCGALESMGRPRLRIEGADDETAADLSSELLHPDFFTRTFVSTWRTDCGSIDVLADIPDADGQPLGYEDLIERATLTPTGVHRIPVASLDDIIDSKTFADRAKDRAALDELHDLRRRRLGG